MSNRAKIEVCRLNGKAAVRTARGHVSRACPPDYGECFGRSEFASVLGHPATACNGPLNQLFRVLRLRRQHNCRNGDLPVDPRFYSGGRGRYDFRGTTPCSCRCTSHRDAEPGPDVAPRANHQRCPTEGVACTAVNRLPREPQRVEAWTLFRRVDCVAEGHPAVALRCEGHRGAKQRRMSVPWPKKIKL
jgi:hypothetical protein